MTSRKPLVVTTAARGRRRVIRALVATVVPCENNATFERSIPALETPLMIPSIGSRVDDVFSMRMRPVASSMIQMSVKVPPTSTATRRFCTIRLPFERPLAALTLGRARGHARIQDPGAADVPFDQRIQEMSEGSYAVRG